MTKATRGYDTLIYEYDLFNTWQLLVLHPCGTHSYRRDGGKRNTPPLYKAIDSLSELLPLSDGHTMTHFHAS